MPNNWIGRIYLTDETELLDADGAKIHDLIPCDQGASVPVNTGTHPVLASKLTSGFIPDMTEPTNSLWPYKIIADPT